MSCLAFVAEAFVANFLTGLVGIGLLADGYIFPNDGYGVIPVEVGNMKAGKWSGITTTDKKPVRVFRVTLIERSGCLTRATRGLFRQLIQFYNARLSPSFYSLPLFP